MSRREEVEATIHTFSKWLRDAGTIEAFERRHNDLALTLADEVDERDAIIDKLLELLEPGVTPPKSHAYCDCFDCRCHKINEGRYTRACEIAGRKE